MTPQDFLHEVVRPNVAEFHANYASVRHAYNAIAAVDALAAHLFHTFIPVDAKDDTEFRDQLAKSNPDFRLLRDLAKAQKHVRLTRGAPEISRAEQISTRSISFGEGPFGGGRFGGPPQVVVDLAPGTMRYVEGIVDQALSFLEKTLSALESSSTGSPEFGAAESVHLPVY